MKIIEIDDRIFAEIKRISEETNLLPNEIISELLPILKKELSLDMCIANCENSASGNGVTEKIINQLFAMGIDAFTSGNHLWDNKHSLDYLQSESRICKPLNYPEKAVGANYCTIAYEDKKIVILTLIGQAFMPASA